MKKLLFVVLMINILIVPVFADLLQDVDKLTPEQAELFQRKLEQKRFEGLPKNTRMGGMIQFIDPAQFNSAITGMPIRCLYGGAFDLRMPVSDRLLIGGSFSGGGNYTYNDSISKIYEDLMLGYGAAQFVMEFRLFQNQSFIVSLTPGAGVMIGGYNYTKTDDNARTYYNTNRWGSGFCTSLALDAVWKIYNEWGMGIGVTSFSGKLSGMRKLFSHVDNSVPDIDLTGTSVRISGSKAF